MAICYKLDIFQGKKYVDTEVVKAKKLNDVMEGFRDDGYTIKKTKVDC